MHRLVAVSNRLPLGDNPSGGLVVALQDALGDSGGLWVGFSGEPSDAPQDSLEFHDGARFDRAAFDLTAEDYESYYLGFSNSVLWPAFHGRADLIEIKPEYLQGYRRVNDRIADLLLPHLKPDDRIWIQDYQLIPLAAALRERGVTNRIGFFLHIPFPDPAICAALPNPGEMFGWFSNYDLIGFQARRDLRNFIEGARQLSQAEPLDDQRLRLCGRETRAGAFPIGIDAAGFIDEARGAREEDRMRSLTDSKMMIGVDRLDYSKGIPQRFRAFQLLLENNPDLIEKVMLLQIAPPTRESVEAYQNIREETEHLAGRINGQFATVNWTPIRFIHRPIPRHELAGLYRQANVGLVTPLADGMNLVAKEYVAAQDVADPGVLILSRFAGAAEDMTEAVIVNPHDPWDMAAAMKRAIEMTPNERRRRHAALLQDVVEHDVSWWVDRYLQTLG
ncbi:trehalose-6-phosphate synthase [Paracoccus aurantiacus]|uniref:Trehalose-6-phosphate synthase n=1 Tax=Paracoccus aurantiacus TaxID=2599412 RepID=A0A5C6S1P9_9RHOB|nr:trehalose-6-phosphate synthase [Paracoccus aurantiacus]TXB68155.1 trehalose-6-phosphate synthase [Paracoccus aurantiacus]